MKHFFELLFGFFARRQRLSQTFVCPPEVSHVILEILTYTMLYIRQSQNPALAKVAASHAHNLPQLLSDFSAMGLRRYWEDDRVWLQKRAQELGGEVAILETIWKESEPIVTRFLEQNSN